MACLLVCVSARCGVCHARSSEDEPGDLLRERSPLSLRLVGAYRTLVGVQEWVAEARLVVDLGAFVRHPSRSRPSAAWAHDDGEEGSSHGAQAPEAPPPPPTAPEPPGEPQERQTAGTADAPEPPPRLTSDLARATVRASLDASGARASEAQLQDVLSRARLSSFLPELRVRVGRNLDESQRFAPTNDDPYYFTSTGAADWRFEVRVTWQLHRLVYVKEELTAERYRRQDRERALERARHTLDALFDWQRGALEESNRERLPEERLAGTLRRLQAEVRLDVLTNGWFSRHLADRERISRSRSQASRPSPRKKRKNGLAGGAARE